MKKHAIAKLFLYRYRFIIGYIILGIAYTALLFALPLFAQNGLSDAEIQSTVNSYYISSDAVLNGDLVDLPYRILQRLSVSIFGLSAYTIKLPSILIGLVFGLLLILLLNRWFKSNVSLLASCLIVLSTPFLFLAGSGTPLIMIVFWPTLLLWLGSKIQGEKKPKPSYCLLFGVAMLLSIFTPYMLYFAIFCVAFVIYQPHLRFIVKTLPKIPLIITGLFILGGIAALIINIISNPATIIELLFATDFQIGDFLGNIANGLAPVFSWRTSLENVFLSPLISLPVFIIALIGLFSTTKGFFASRNSIASLLIVFTLIITGFRPDAVIFFILPISILVAHGLKYILEKWYGLFPENPYARIFAILPLSILYGVMIIPSLLQYIYGYRYNPSISNEFSTNLTIINKSLQNGETIITEDHLDFYSILEDTSSLNVLSNEEYQELLATETESPDNLAFLQKPEATPTGYTLSRIITSAKSDNSDIIYLYRKGE